ncbi:unnamed protein product [Linum tenue]|uniref:Uncharacterized protein n=1 Tax=Linum tenue TaxID=586396 RepID=A0AAV0PJV9_9ROSI|nr:unnamed protein product [Linum tenue]
MATLCQFQCFLPSLLPRNLFFFTKQQQSLLHCDGLTWSIHDHRHNLHHLSSRERSLVCACSVRTPRKKAKSNDELRNEIREFLCAFGLPEGHVPSTKELTENGRSDLANVVRRRGYKRIRELLVNSPSLEVEESSEDLDVDNPSSTLMDLMANESFEEKVAKFIHTGDLGAIEDAVSSPSNAFSENVPTTVTPQLAVKQAFRSDDPSAKSQTLSDLEKDFVVETDRREQQIEIKDIELMMFTLFDLKRKAEAEITKARNLPAEKDAELSAAEESLKGLVQVTIQYHGDGQSVEVLGSFNGWHHKIVMDPKPSSDEDIMESSNIMTDAEQSSDENIAESSYSSPIVQQSLEFGVSFFSVFFLFPLVSSYLSVSMASVSAALAHSSALSLNRPSSSFLNSSTSTTLFVIPSLSFHSALSSSVNGSRPISCLATKKGCSVEQKVVVEEEEEEEGGGETLLYSVSPLPLLFLAALPGAGAVRSVFGPFVEIVQSLNLPGWLVHWGHPGNMAVVLFAMGGYGTYLGFRIRYSDDVEEKAKAKDLHPKLLAGMFFFFALGATGGVTSLLTSDRPILESPHAVTGIIGLALLTLQTVLPSLFEGNPGLRNVHGILGSGIMTLFLIHGALGLQLGLSY